MFKVWLFLLAISALSAVGCGGPNQVDPNDLSSNSSTSIPSPAPAPAPALVPALSASPMTFSVVVSQSQQIIVSGGTPPYSGTVSSGCGSFNNANLIYAAPANPGTCVIQIQDASGAIVSPTATVSPDITAQAIYRYQRSGGGDFYFSTSATVPSGYISQNVGFNLFTNPSSTRKQLYSCIWTNFGTHFMSSDPNCEGWQNDGARGYAETQSQTWATKPLYRCVGGSVHLETLNSAECTNNGFSVEFILGYTP